MKTILSALMITLMFGLAGCSSLPPLRIDTPNITEALAAKCVEEAPGRMSRAKYGDQREQYNVGKNLFNGCTAGRVKQPEEALPWLEASAKQNGLAANAFLANRVYGTNALLKHQAGQDWAADEVDANRYTDKAIEIWENADRKGFNKVELGELQNALNMRGLMSKRLYGDKIAAAKYYCLVFEVSTEIGGAKDASENLKGIGKTKADCK